VATWTLLGRGVTLAGAMVLVLTACGEAAGSSDPGPADGQHTLVARTGPVACKTTDLTASVGEYGSAMSQPFLTVKLTNHTATPCRLRGYPRLTIMGTFAQRPARPVDVDVTHGSTYERADPGPHPLLVAPHRFAAFTIGTGTAFPRPATLHRFEIRLGTEDDALVVNQDMPTSGRVGKPLSALETAVGLGMPKPPG
jgi:uncharacterized protein DUF4232